MGGVVLMMCFRIAINIILSHIYGIVDRALGGMFYGWQKYYI